MVSFKDGGFSDAHTNAIALKGHFEGQISRSVRIILVKVSKKWSRIDYKTDLDYCLTLICWKGLKFSLALSPMTMTPDSKNLMQPGSNLTFFKPDTWTLGLSAPVSGQSRACLYTILYSIITTNS